MSKMKVFAIKDSKAEAYGVPYFQPTNGLALRMFLDIASDAQTQVAKYPADFGLFAIGEYDMQTGILVPSDMPEFLGLASDLLSAVEQRRAA